MTSYSEWLISKYPSLIVVAAWLDEFEGTITLDMNAPHSQHLLNRTGAPIILLNAEGLQLALESPLKDHLRYRTFSYSQSDICINGLSYRIKYSDMTVDDVKETILHPNFEHYMLGIFFDNMPSLIYLKQAEGVFKIMSTNLKARHTILGLPNEVREGVNAAAHLITEAALIGNLVDTQSKFEFPGLVGTFFWTRDGLSVTFASYNPKQKFAAISCVKSDLTLSRTGYADIIERYLLSTYPQLNSLIPLYTFKLDKLNHMTI